MTPMLDTTKSPAAKRQELIAFRIGAQEFCIDIMSVREIRGWTQTTPVPQAPAFLRGVINLRGTTLPVVDLAARLGLPVSEPSARHAIIVAQVGEHTLGFLVDAVCDIMTMSEDELHPAPEVAYDPNRSFVRGLLTVEDRILVLVTLDSQLLH
jgi:purine-binding chemotaxis protein CheW